MPIMTFWRERNRNDRLLLNNWYISSALYSAEGRSTCLICLSGFSIFKVQIIFFGPVKKDHIIWDGWSRTGLFWIKERWVIVLALSLQKMETAKVQEWREPQEVICSLSSSTSLKEPVLFLNDVITCSSEMKFLLPLTTCPINLPSPFLEQHLP